ncbi:hypothetical protein OUZ56_028404 [Daphnia magna]|uniref:Uncharacterized protein n=1 Tax=Daphnia magna TaxID=35525 RepID=A0ABR0B3X4_9CRUS|nr:hypothetical protein OUZ56_028404 [Daphnia magna]
MPQLEKKHIKSNRVDSEPERTKENSTAGGLGNDAVLNRNLSIVSYPYSPHGPEAIKIYFGLSVKKNKMETKDILELKKLLH